MLVPIKRIYLEYVVEDLSAKCVYAYLAFIASGSCQCGTIVYMWLFMSHIKPIFNHAHTHTHTISYFSIA